MPTMQTGIDDKPFAEPVRIRYPDGDVSVGSVRQARDLLASVEWPGPRDGLHENALDTCLKVLEGHRSTEDGRQRLVEAALAAGIYAGHRTT